VFFFLVHLTLRRLLRLVAGRSAAAALEVENVVLRHQLVVLRRTVKRPELRRRDRVVWAVASELLPRGRWPAFVVFAADALAVAAGTGAQEVDVSAAASGSASAGR
jgi:hypothetical protein